MRILKFASIIALLLFITVNCDSSNKKTTPSYDVVVYGGSSAGITAAIQVARMGKTVVVIEQSSRIGGLTTGGLGQTDIGNKIAIGGISREFYEGISTYYSKSENWKWQKKSEYKDGGQTTTEKGENSMWTFEPSAAMSVYKDMLKGLDIKFEYNQMLDREKGVEKIEGEIKSITMVSGENYTGKMFIDATYEGDLMASSGVSYATGRESNSEYGENLNGVQANYSGFTLTGLYSINGQNHNFVDSVDPYIVKGDPKSGLVFGVNSEKVAADGTGDKKIQAYCFRMCLTDSPENRIPFSKPANYNEAEYELLFRNYEAGYAYIPWINSAMPNRKTDTNNAAGFSTDYIGQNYDYPEASYAERKIIVENHKNYQQGLMWTLANDTRIPKDVRDEVSRWGTCKDEFENKDGWQNQLYIREARRMVSDLVMSQKYCERIEVVKEPIGLAAYGMDSHNTQRYITEDNFVKNEGNIEAHVKGPFSIGYKSIIPSKKECTNLSVPICLSSTHIAFGSIRMEPVFMVLGQSAATAAVIAIKNNTTLQNIDYKVLKKRLLADIQRITL